MDTRESGSESPPSWPCKVGRAPAEDDDDDDSLVCRLNRPVAKRGQMLLLMETK